MTRESHLPDSPVRFDARLNEYYFAYRKSAGPEAKMTIYHCPFCGGRAVNTRRADVFNHLSDAERHRLTNLTKDLRTVQDVAAALGEPDLRRTMSPDGDTTGLGGSSDTTRFFPVMIYTRLSETANIMVIIFPGDRVGISFHPKTMAQVAA